MTARQFIAATTVDEALSALSEHTATARIMAGATWLMRAPLRGEDLPGTVVSISGITELSRIDIGEEWLTIGARVTHAELASALAAIGEFRGLAEAAGKSANPAIRSVATVGGNLYTVAFAAADLVPALLCLDAEIEYRSIEGTSSMPLEAFLHLRTVLPPGLLTEVRVRRGSFRSAHARLPLRKAGDYPVAIVSATASSDDRAGFQGIRIAVGSVEVVARRWPALEAEIEGRAMTAAEFGVAAADLSSAFAGRDGIEAPGWYRVQVLPALVRRAFEDLERQRGS